ncbi:hypothetical protein P4O66_002604 [Electrophorus voltai]|uniref:Uncharacterized protein n=1 Tax=Electrophorus voltai TaxID=2609070 RepID=A0AAD9DQA8_9TELE|nr:hypothetical protein P4O66_002604 [Electrophorus voltai]
MICTVPKETSHRCSLILPLVSIVLHVFVAQYSVHRKLWLFLLYFLSDAIYAVLRFICAGARSGTSHIFGVHSPPLCLRVGNYGGVYVGLPTDLTTVASSQSKSTRKGPGGCEPSTEAHKRGGPTGVEECSSSSPPEQANGWQAGVAEQGHVSLRISGLPPFHNPQAQHDSFLGCLNARHILQMEQWCGIEEDSIYIHMRGDGEESVHLVGWYALGQGPSGSWNIISNHDALQFKAVVKEGKITTCAQCEF